MITITVNGGLSENSLEQSNDSNGEFEQRSRPRKIRVWPQAFHMEEMLPRQSGCTWEEQGQAAATLCPLRGVCAVPY